MKLTAEAPKSEVITIRCNAEEKRYRYESKIGEYLSGPRLVLYLWELPVLRHTPAGVIVAWCGTEKFVLNGDDGKRLAYTTPKAALWSFIKRKAHQRAYAKRTLDHATIAGTYAEQLHATENYHGLPTDS